MQAPDNAATAADRTSVPRVTLASRERGRFADRYGAATVPARVRKPRDKGVAESCVDPAGRWIIGPSNEMTSCTIEELDELCAEKAARPNARPFSAKDGSRDSVFEEEERMRPAPLPAERCEMRGRRGAKVAPDCRVTAGCMRCSVDHPLIGEQVDVKPASSAVAAVRCGEAVAARPRLRGRKGQHPAMVERMPGNHAAPDGPRPPDRLASWARRIGPEAEAAIGRVLASRPIVEQSFASCRNILGLSKTYAPGLRGRACARTDAASALPGHAGLKNAILAMKAADAEARANGKLYLARTF